MKAIVINKYGSPEGLLLQEVKTPVPKDHEVRVKIHATTVTYGDAKLRSFKGPLRLVFGLFFGLRKNKILGHELAGEVESIGRNVSLFKPGDQVFATTGMDGGAYAEYICLPEDGLLAIKPANLTFEEAAAVPVGAITALDILRTGSPQPGDQVLIYGASGSVGTYAVQLAKYYGAEVTGVCSTTNLEMVKSLGADQVIDYTKDDFTQSDDTYDVIFDAVGKISPEISRKSVEENGVYLSVKSSITEAPTDLVFLRELIETGKLVPVIDRRYTFEQIPEAHRYVDQGHKKGNVVISVVQNDITRSPEDAP